MGPWMVQSTMVPRLFLIKGSSQQRMLPMSSEHQAPARSHCTCLACGADEAHQVPELAKVIRSMFSIRTIMSCNRCGLGRLDPMPDAATIHAVYSDPSYVASYEQAGEDFVVSEKNAEAQLAPRLDLLERYVPGRGKLLDIGASRGIFLAQAQKRGWQPLGLEAGADAIAYAQSHFGITIQHGTLESATLESNAIDCVHLSHVLEHLLDPLASLQKIASTLKPGGTLALEVPYEYGDLFDRVRALVLRRARSPNSVPSSHLYFFTIDSLRRMLERAGFTILQVNTPRRNASYESRLPIGRFVKRLIYRWEQSMRLGPMIEIYARKKHTAINQPDRGTKAS